MKKFLLSLTILCYSLGLFAQAVNLTGYVITPDGAPVSGIDIFIGTNLSMETVQTDANGFFGLDVGVEPNVVGTIYVQMVDCDSSLYTQEFEYTPNLADITTTLVYCENGSGGDNCELWIETEYFDPIGSEAYLFAHTTVVTDDYMFYWSTGDEGPETVAEQSGIYCVTITSASCPDGANVACTDVQLSGNPDCSAYVDWNDIGGLQAFADGTPPFTFQWNNGETTQVIAAIDAQFYCVTITDANGCTAEACQNNGSDCIVTIWANPSNPNVDQVIAPAILFAEGQGTGAIEYVWSTNEFGQEFYAELPGIYCVEMIDQTGCTASACIEVIPEIVVDTFCFVNIIDEGISPTGLNMLIADAQGMAPFTYQWNDGQTGSEIFVQGPGFFCVTVTDAIGCVSESCYDLEENQDCGLEWSCDPDPAGGLFLSAFGWGVEPITYEWSTGQTTSEITITDSGFYCVTITDAVGCTSDHCQQVDIENICFVNIELDSLNTGLALFADAFGVEPFQYFWSTGEETEVIFVTENGTYCVDVIDAMGCLSSSCFDIGNPNPDCSVIVESADSTGVNILFANVEGEGPFEYIWNTGETTQYIVMDNNQDSYCVEVTSVTTGCGAYNCYENIPDCGIEFLCDPAPGGGLILMTNTWGEEPFTYQWSTGETTSEIFVEEDGVYCVTVTDATGCEAEWCQDVIIDIIDQCELQPSYDQLASGEYVLYTNGIGVLPIEYIWDNGDVGESIVVAEAGTYCVEMIDAMGCSNFACIDVGQIDPDCFVFIEPLDSANMLIAYAEGEGPFEYYWNTGETTQQIVMGNNSDIYCVEAISVTTGCVSTACYEPFPNECGVEIGVNPAPDAGGAILIAATWGQGPFTYEWNTGETTSEIFVEEDGVYCVTVTDATGCEAEWCEDVFIGSGPCFLNPTFEAINNSGTEFIVSANGEGTEPIEYYWNNGNTGENIFVNGAGTYCVEMVDATGCTNFACVDIEFPNPDDCSVTIFPADSAGVNILEAYPSGIAPYTYEWNNGSTSNYTEINPIIGNEYCVTITDANNCVAEACYITTDLPEYWNITGYVYPIMDPAAAVMGYAYLVKVDDTGQAIVCDTTEILLSPNSFGGFYNFGDVPVGQYFVKAELFSTMAGFEDFLPTYYGDVLFWSDAEVINIPYGGISSFDINLIPGDGLTGPGGINGIVTDGNGLWDGNIEDRNGTPLPNVSVLLLDVNDNPFTHRLTDEEGRFEFNDLPWGTYKVYIEIIGGEPIFQIITIGPDNPIADDIEFEIASTVAIADVIEEDGVAIFPNPVGEVAYIQIESNALIDAQFSILNVNGQLLHQETQSINRGVQTLRLDATRLTSGLYFLTISNGKEVITKKMVKQ